jgi:hypothetical protein
MNAIEDFRIDFAALEQKISIPLPVARNLDELDQAIRMFTLGNAVDLGALAGSLFHVTEWIKTRTSSKRGSSSAWKATYFGSPDFGGMLTCQKDVQELIFSLDSGGIPYLGMWNIQLPGEESRGTSFKIENSPEGMQLILDDGKNQQSHKLPGAEGLLWGTLDGFLEKVNGPQAAPSPPEALPPPSPPVASGDAGASSPPALTAPPPPPPLVTEAACSRCRNPIKPGVKFCGNCGAPVGGSPAATPLPPAAAPVCSCCGNPLRPGVKFCRNCGQPV